MGYMSHLLGSRRIGFRRESKIKITLIILLLSVAGLAVVFQLVYPLTIRNGVGFLLQIPRPFWIFIACALASLFVLALLTRSPTVTLVSITGTALILNFHNFLIYGVSERDMRGEISRYFFTLGKNHLGIDLYSYFQWPVHFIVTQQLDRVISQPLIQTVWIGYVSYYVLFAIGIGVFAYSFTSGEQFSWITAGVFYVIFTRQWLNNQFVPQFIALVILLFLFSIHSIPDIRTKILRGVIYSILVLSHPFMFVFYVLFVGLLPFTRALVRTFDRIGTLDMPMYRKTFTALMRLPTTVRTFQHELRKALTASWVGYLTFLVAVYILFFTFRFVLFKRQLLLLFSGPMNNGYSGKLPSRMIELVLGSSRNGGGQQVASGEVLLYELTSELLKNSLLNVTIGVFLALLLLSLIGSLRGSSRELSAGSIAIMFSGLVYYIVGFSLPIVGSRAYQIIFLPLGTLLDNSPSRSTVIKIIVAVLVVLSPVIVANTLVNYSLSGGRNTHSYHGDEAGRFLTTYSTFDDGGVVKYPAAGFPSDISKTGAPLPVITIEAALAENRIQPNLIVFGELQETQTRYFNYRCNYNPYTRNKIYDNSVVVLDNSIVSEEFSCSINR
jgi:hypothetical protein